MNFQFIELLTQLKIAIKEGNYLLRAGKWIKQGKLLCVRKRLNISLQAQTYWVAFYRKDAPRYGMMK